MNLRKYNFYQIKVPRYYAQESYYRHFYRYNNRNSNDNPPVIVYSPYHLMYCRTELFFLGRIRIFLLDGEFIYENQFRHEKNKDKYVDAYWLNNQLR